MYNLRHLKLYIDPLIQEQRVCKTLMDLSFLRYHSHKMLVSFARQQSRIRAFVRDIFIYSLVFLHKPTIIIALRQNPGL